MSTELRLMINYYKKHIENELSHAEFEEAKRYNYLFEYPEPKSHKQILDETILMARKIKKEDVANAFLYSLSTRKLEYRSILSSYWYAVSLFPHEQSHDKRCNICNWFEIPQNVSDNYKKKYGYNILNLERFKWGGVRHDQLIYVYLDLKLFLELPKVNPKNEDYKILFNTLSYIDKLQPNNKVGKYSDYIVKHKPFPTNKNEVKSFLEILGICGVLSSKKYPCCDEKYIPADSSRDPVEHLNDFLYPVNRWKASDGVNKSRFNKVLGIDFE